MSRDNKKDWEIDLESLVLTLRDHTAALGRIATALEQSHDDANRCQHGGTGICMHCIVQLDLLRPRP